MTRRNKRAYTVEASGIRKEPGRAPLSIYQVGTYGVLLFLLATAVVLLNHVKTRDRTAVASANAASQAHLAATSATAEERENAFHSQRRSAVRADVEKTDSKDPSALQELRRLNEVLSKAGPDERRAAAALRHFARTGAMADLRKVERRDVVELAEYLGRQLSADEVGELLHQSLGFSPGTTLTKEKAGSSLVDIYDALAGNRLEEVRPSALMVTDAADTTGRIKGRTDVLPAGTKRVYAVFENDRALQGLDQVLTVWRNPSDDRMVFTQFEPVRRGSAYNYVWLDVKSGWPAGQYQVELFHPEAQSLLLASESFSIR